PPMAAGTRRYEHDLRPSDRMPNPARCGKPAQAGRKSAVEFTRRERLALPGRHTGDRHMSRRPFQFTAFGLLCGALLATLAAASGAIISAGRAGAQEFTMKFATLTINDVQHEFIKMYKAEIEKTTNNRIKVEVYPAGQLGSAARQAEGLRLGTIEAASGPAELFVGADPRFQGLAMAG